MNMKMNGNTHQFVSENSVGRNGVQDSLYTIFVPLNFNSGHPMPQARLSWVQSKILHYAGGLTSLPLAQVFGLIAAQGFTEIS
jgi:hypothetical protein